MTDMGAQLRSMRETALKEADRLMAEGRTDESTFMKIEANVYDAFSQVWNAANKYRADDAAAFFLQKLEEIPRGWLNAKAAAEAHGDSRKAFIEETKLRTVENIRRHMGDNA